MLTSVFYFNFYKPYIVGNVSNRGNDNYIPRRERIAAGRENGSDASPRKYVLNKALRNEIVQYAQAVSFGVTDLRAATKQTAYDMEHFNQSIYVDGFQTAVDNLAEDLAHFAEDFNRSAGFMQTQAHSAGLRAFSGEVAQNVYENRTRLEMLGLTLSNAGQMAFSREQITSMSRDEINMAIGETIEIFEGLRNYTQQLMTEPLVEHMRFRGLNYHYNYRMGTMETEGYSLLEAGMLVDRLV
ncbi:MAG: hypothetical protein FWE05_08650 [Defluviitaleaceae bacterium]|nr:hypothetical protein [Defluviitaleaceae bacterium]